MPVPPSVIRIKPAEAYQVRWGKKVPGQKAPQATDYFIVTKLDGGKQISIHPISENHPRELDIMLLHDDPRKNFRDGISMWDGKRPACYNREGGDTAYRRDSLGAFKPIECNLDKCPFWMNAHGDSTVAKRILANWASDMPHLRISEDSKCTVEFYFYFLLPGITAVSGEVARCYTRSLNSYNQILTALTMLGASTNGVLAMIPLKLKLIQIRDTHGGLVPTITVVAPTTDVKEWNEIVFEHFKQRSLNAMNWAAYQEFLSLRSLAESTEQDADFISDHWTMRGKEGRELPASTEPKDEGDGIQEAEVIDVVGNNIQTVCDYSEVSKLCELLKLNYAARNQLQLMYGLDDKDKAIMHLTKQCIKQGLLDKEGQPLTKTDSQQSEENIPPQNSEEPASQPQVQQPPEPIQPSYSDEDAGDPDADPEEEPIVPLNADDTVPQQIPQQEAELQPPLPAANKTTLSDIFGDV